MPVAPGIVVRPNTGPFGFEGQTMFWVGVKGLVAGFLVALGIGTGAGVAAFPAYERQWRGEAPPPPLPIHASLLDLRPLSVTLTVGWQRTTIETTVERFLRDPFLTRNMHFSDWDRLPAEVREPALARMRERHVRVLGGPAVWALMDAHAWDAVPQPIRMVVFPLMVQYWVQREAVGKAFNIDPRLVTKTTSAIVMAESWFEHRAFFENEWGNRDIGVGQCSNRCRRELAGMAERGVLDFSFTDDDYFNPWHATRAAVVWFGLELARARGDVPLAIRAYHRGFEAAHAGEGAAYLENVLRVRERYFASSLKSPTWRALRGWAWQSAPVPAGRDVETEAVNRGGYVCTEPESF
ncbi:MAG: transglycosylase SLT domain-containing protein [Acidobacteriota bacterium]|nr:transglycosylase SLT domain-containing protein [Acidobacteriota bacterium]